jgi:hypothetical protein
MHALAVLLPLLVVAKLISVLNVCSTSPHSYVAQRAHEASVLYCLNARKQFAYLPTAAVHIGVSMLTAALHATMLYTFIIIYCRL